MDAENKENSAPQTDAPKLTLEDFENLGRAFGAIAAAFRRGFEAGYTNVTENVTGEDDDDLDSDFADDSEAGEKTQLDDCEACLCNTCANIEKCRNADEGREVIGGKPYPCVDCGDGMRYICVDEVCEGYVKAASGNYV